MNDKERWVALRGLKFDEIIEFYKTLRLDVKIRIYVNSYQNQDYPCLSSMLSPNVEFIGDWDYRIAHMCSEHYSPKIIPSETRGIIQGYWECTVGDIHPAVMKKILICKCAIRYDAITACKEESWASRFNSIINDEFPKGTVDKWTTNTNNFDIKPLNLFK